MGILDRLKRKKKTNDEIPWWEKEPEPEEDEKPVRFEREWSSRDELPGSRRVKRIAAIVLMILYGIATVSLLQEFPYVLVLFGSTIYLLFDYLALTRGS